MSGDNQEILILQDESGEYYAVPRSAIERFRVPAQHRETIQQMRARQTVLGRDYARIHARSFATLYGRFDRTRSAEDDATPERTRNRLISPASPQLPVVLGWFDLELPGAQA
jgi:hypothetical protein